MLTFALLTPFLHAGDSFASATVISGQSGSSTESNQNATTEAGEPRYGINRTAFRTLWWKWTAPSNGRASIDLAGSATHSGGSLFGKYLGVWVAKSESPAVNSLALVHSSGGQTLTAPRVLFPAVAGTTYYIQVASYTSSEFGDIKVSTTLDTSSDINNYVVEADTYFLNDRFVDRRSLAGNVATIAYSKSATTETSEPFIGGKSMWWEWLAPSNGRLTISTVGSDQFDGASTWTKQLGVFLGDSLSNARLCSRSTATFPQITIPVTSGQVYQIGLGSDSITEGGSIVLSLDLATNTDVNALNIGRLASAANDLFGNRIPLQGSFVSTIGYGAYATTEALEPASAGYGTMCWTYTAPATGTVSLSTTGSSTADTKYVAAWTGGSLPGLSLVARSASSTTPVVSFAVTAGQTYQISVGGRDSNDTAGTVVLSLSGPPGPADAPVTGLVVDAAVRLRFPTELYKSYRIRGSTDLQNWSNIGSAFVGNGQVMEAFQVASPPARFFQVYSP